MEWAWRDDANGETLEEPSQFSKNSDWRRGSKRIAPFPLVAETRSDSEPKVTWNFRLSVKSDTMTVLLRGPYICLLYKNLLDRFEILRTGEAGIGL